MRVCYFSLILRFSSSWVTSPSMLLVVEIKHEVNNEHDKLAIAISHSKRIVGHVPKNVSKFFYQFLSLRNCAISCEVTSKRVNRGGGYGLEIPVRYTFLGPNKAIEWIEKSYRNN